MAQCCCLDRQILREDCRNKGCRPRDVCSIRLAICWQCNQAVLHLTLTLGLTVFAYLCCFLHFCTSLRRLHACCPWLDHGLTMHVLAAIHMHAPAVIYMKGAAGEAVVSCFSGSISRCGGSTRRQQHRGDRVAQSRQNSVRRKCAYVGLRVC